MNRRAGCATFALLMASAAAVAGEPHGIAFSHHDWELACDNTRTCRAAGYQPLPDDGDDADADADDDSGEDDGAADEALPMSVLLTRQAGPDQPVLGEFQIGHGGVENTDPDPLSLTMLVDAKPVGQVALAQGQWTARLTPGQTQALLAVLPHHGRIAWTDGKRTWKLS
ncbi:MAG TPA: DUF1176 domain-containing protein, partial [Pseudoduganella sp.]